MLERMGEIGAQLEKEDGFVENVKSMLIPVLNHFLGSEVLEVAGEVCRLKRRRGRKWRRLP